MRHALSFNELPRMTLVRHFRSRLRPARGPVEAVSLVNVVLLLLLFFMLNSGYVLQPGLVLDLPEAVFTAGARYGALVVTLTQEGMVFFNDERTTLEGLESGFAQAVFEQPEATLMIEADARVNHGTLVQIYNMAAASGIHKVVMATRGPSTPAGGAP